VKPPTAEIRSSNENPPRSSGGVVSPSRAGREPPIYLLLVAAALIASGIKPYDRLTWLLEVFPILLGAPILILTYRRFRFTPLVYRLIFLHALILILGGYYTYARVPLGFWVQELFDLSRNHYDRLGHLAQGFVPALIARELLLRTSPLRAGKWLSFLAACVCLALSVTYEFIEWGAALALGQSADEFLGTQGDPWDTQWDMFLAGVGAVLALWLLRSTHDRQLRAFHVGGRP
jgi:putative membrane protein